MSAAIVTNGDASRPTWGTAGGRAAASAGPGANIADAQEVPPGITDDLGDETGESMRSSADIGQDPCNQKLTLEDMVLGFDAPECTP